MTIYFSYLRIISVIVFLLYSNIYLSAQPTFQKVFPQSRIHSLKPTSDGGVIFITRNELTKLKCNGKVEWAKNLGDYVLGLAASKVIEIENGDFIITYRIKQSGSLDRPNIAVIRVDSLGELIWFKQYGSLSTSEVPVTLTPTNDGGYLIGGTIRPQTNVQYDNFYFLKIDSLGNLEWSKLISENPNIHNRIISSIEDQDGNFIHIGQNLLASSNLHESFILKMNSDGEVIYYKVINSPPNIIALLDIALTFENDLLFTGSYLGINDSLSNSLIMKLNSNGDLLYTKSLASYSEEIHEGTLAILSNQNGGYSIGISALKQMPTPQSPFGLPFLGIMGICKLDENENYIGGIGYDFNVALTNGTEYYFHLESRNDGGFNKGFTYFAIDSLENLQLNTVVMQLDENGSTGCDDYDISDLFYLTDDLGWSLIDKSYTSTPHGESFDHPITIEDYQHDTIITLCENIAQADFSIDPCIDEPIYFTDMSAGNIISREWNFNNGEFVSTDENPIFEFSGTGVFPVQLVVSDGCVTDTLWKEIEVMPTIISEADTVVCSSRPIYFNGNVFTENVVEAQTFSYVDTLSNVLGCDSIDILNVLVEPCSCDLTFPNVFTPDDDGINDLFRPVIACDFMVENYYLKIINRWGQVVFETQDPEAAWDGTYKGKAFPMDVLIFQTQYDVKDEDGTLIRQAKKVSDLTLLR